MGLYGVQPCRPYGAERGYAGAAAINMALLRKTRIPQIVMVCDWIFHSTAYEHV